MAVRCVDLSHTMANGMPGFRLKNEDGTLTEFTAEIRPFLTHAQTAPKYQGKAAFEITDLHFQTSIGTYLDSPYHRYAERRDISQIRIEETILPGIVVDARKCQPGTGVGPEVLPPAELLTGKAVLVLFGWDRYWGQENYYAYPFLTRPAVEYLLSAGIRLLGVDTLNVDDSRDPERPAHSWLLAQDILIVENLTGLEALLGQTFTFWAVPLKVERAAAMPVRAFATVGEGAGLEPA